MCVGCLAMEILLRGQNEMFFSRQEETCYLASNTRFIAASDFVSPVSSKIDKDLHGASLIMNRPGKAVGGRADRHLCWHLPVLRNNTIKRLGGNEIKWHHWVMDEHQILLSRDPVPRTSIIFCSRAPCCIGFDPCVLARSRTSCPA